MLASRERMKVMMEKEPKAMLLNNARPQWVTLYVGKKPWKGTSKLSKHKGLSVEDEPLEMDSHFLNARESDDPLLKRLIEAFDADNPTDTASAD